MILLVLNNMPFN